MQKLLMLLSGECNLILDGSGEYGGLAHVFTLWDNIVFSSSFCGTCFPWSVWSWHGCPDMSLALIPLLPTFVFLNFSINWLTILQLHIPKPDLSLLGSVILLLPEYLVCRSLMGCKKWKTAISFLHKTHKLTDLFMNVKMLKLFCLCYTWDHTALSSLVGSIYRMKIDISYPTWCSSFQASVHLQHRLRAAAMCNASPAWFWFGVNQLTSQSIYIYISGYKLI